MIVGLTNPATYNITEMGSTIFTQTYHRQPEKHAHLTGVAVPPRTSEMPSEILMCALQVAVSNQVDAP